MTNELIAIPLQPNYIETVDGILGSAGLRPHFYQNLDAWEDVACPKRSEQQAKATGAPPAEQPPEACLLLIGALDEIAELRLAERITEVHPGLPIVAVSDTASLAQVVRVMRQGVTDVVDLSHEPNGFVDSVQEALDLGRESSADRIRIRELRRRLLTLTPAERDVLDAMMNGLANKETAKSLGIGLRTVELRRSKIMRKMGAKSIGELVRLFFEARCPGVDARAAGE